MSMAPLLGLPGRIKTLIDRLTATRAANLDRLDATISTRALASTAVSRTDLTTARIALLDKLINLDGKISEAGGGLKTQVFTSSGTWTRPEGVNMVMVSGCAGGCGGGGGGGLIIYSSYRINGAHGARVSGAGRAGGIGYSSFGGTGSGGAAGQSCLRVPVYVTANQSVVVGAGGAGGAGGRGGLPNSRVQTARNGSAGGSTSFGSLVLSIGSYSPGYTQGIIGGQLGSAGISGTAGSSGTAGGTSLFGAINGAYGHGGGGGNGASRNQTEGADGQAGDPGILIVEWWE